MRIIGKKVYIGNLSPNVEKHELEKEFCRYGDLQAVWVAQNPPGFGFAIYRTMRDADCAIRAMDGKRMFGSKLVVELAKNQDTAPPPRSGRGRYSPLPQRNYGRRYSPSHARNGAPGGFRTRSPPLQRPMRSPIRRRSPPPMREPVNRLRRYSPPPPPSGPSDRYRVRSRSPLYRPRSPSLPLPARISNSPRRRYERQPSPNPILRSSLHRSISPGRPLSPRRDKFSHRERRY